MDKKDLGKHVGSTVIPAGKNTLSIKRYEKGLIIRKRKVEIVLDTFECMRISESGYMVQKYKPKKAKVSGSQKTGQDSRGKK